MVAMANERSKLPRADQDPSVMCVAVAAHKKSTLYQFWWQILIAMHTCMPYGKQKFSQAIDQVDNSQPSQLTAEYKGLATSKSSLVNKSGRIQTKKASKYFWSKIIQEKSTPYQSWWQILIAPFYMNIGHAVWKTKIQAWCYKQANPDCLIHKGSVYWM